MKVWQVYGEGEAFVIDGKKMAFELSGCVEAEDAITAFSRACELAVRDHPALAQAAGPFPRPVVNPLEIQEVDAGLAVEVGKVQLDWLES
ncbi:hypothetical protein [Rhodoferax sp. OV413]|uniref:hypothetical protein n=1 Tax=Rhodoferax sp. OV413 TaxID=1855285 RepID=UPI00115FC2B3|nr:hypothetical protein [Rhodoferax sp. OV413]